jgi:hypothetical protein
MYSAKTNVVLISKFNVGILSKFIFSNIYFMTDRITVLFKLPHFYIDLSLFGNLVYSLIFPLIKLFLKLFILLD